jgi:hypothetical protein
VLDFDGYATHMQQVCNTDKKIYRTFFGKKLLENVLF